MSTIRPIIQFTRFIKNHFDLQSDLADQNDIQTEIRKGIELRGTNHLVLLFAILIASVGLNVNSTAVIIGAMLVSPLMGPIIGFGLGLGIHDFALMRKSAKVFFFAIFASLAVSTIYFSLSPLGEAHSEILSRTNPTIWDVLVALSGGIAGMIATTRKTKSNVIPGVAIATALMPPICTAGYGIATLQFKYFIGAFYLFFINAIFIAFGATLVVRFLKLKEISIEDLELKKKIDRYFMITVVATVLPSLFLAYRIVQNEVVEQKVRAFVEKEVKSTGTIVLERKIEEVNDRPTIKLVVLSSQTNTKDLTELAKKLPYYNLANMAVEINEYNSEADTRAIKNELLNELANQYKSETAAILQIQNELHKLQTTENDKELTHFTDIKNELNVQIPGIQYIYLGFDKLNSDKSESSQPILLVNIKTKKPISTRNRNNIREWLIIRAKAKDVRILWD